MGMSVIEATWFVVAPGPERGNGWIQCLAWRKGPPLCCVARRPSPVATRPTLPHAPARSRTRTHAHGVEETFPRSGLAGLRPGRNGLGAENVRSSPPAPRAVSCPLASSVPKPPRSPVGGLLRDASGAVLGVSSQVPAKFTGSPTFSCNQIAPWPYSWVVPSAGDLQEWFSGAGMLRAFCIS
jgi:hypothetical protein